MDIFTTIKDNLLRHYIIYVPTILFSKLKGSIYEGVLPEDAANTLFYLFNPKEIIADVNAFSIVALLEKSDILESNLFKLFEAKKTLEEEHFRVLLDKYKEHVEGHAFMTRWMYVNIDKTFANLDVGIINMFKFQAEQFQKHSEELNNHFKIQPNKVPNETIALLEQLKATYASTELKITPPEPIQPLPVSEKAKPTKKQKLIIDDDEIDKFLLSSVFNVDL
ncbi:hypothetical protein [Algibacter lectus]|uniref:Uncharacterized protein n=1 Tax=Algibacter lectus TaxID=221126 RepID=A0A4R8ME82_9FLAO|nr:hypothetical protein [Algibacter lectus]MWW23153.1 hypothetical protein [Algibacter lectus]TDY64169.1 hypothetical protein DFQ06_1072 [Algibacter lectus]